MVDPTQAEATSRAVAETSVFICGGVVTVLIGAVVMRVVAEAAAKYTMSLSSAAVTSLLSHVAALAVMYPLDLAFERDVAGATGADTVVFFFSQMFVALLAASQVVRWRTGLPLGRSMLVSFLYVISLTLVWFVILLVLSVLAGGLTPEGVRRR